MPADQADELLIGLAIHRRRFQPGEPGAIAGLDKSADSRIGFHLDLDCLHATGGQCAPLLRRRRDGSKAVKIF